VAKYQYTGPGPVPDPETGEAVRPGDVREYAEEPGWGPWELVPPPEASEGGEPPGPPEASPAALSAAPALNITRPATPEGM
jgi:hypothetical protein